MNAAPRLQVSLSNRQRHLRLNRAGLLRWLRAAADIAANTVSKSTRLEPFPLLELSVALLDDAKIAEVNERFLNHIGPTDVISFNLDIGVAELVVSTERACIVAKQLHRTPADELALYLAHGLLHLAGLDDHTAAQRRIMRAAERNVLKQLPRLISK